MCHNKDKTCSIYPLPLAQTIKSKYTFWQVLFMGDFFYQVHHILERHLKVGAKLSLNELVKASQEGKGFEVMRGSPLQLSTQEENGGENSILLWNYFLWNSFSEIVTTVSYDGIVARVVRANIECTNGYIHLIDKVVMKVGKPQLQL